MERSDLIFAVLIILGIGIYASKVFNVPLVTKVGSGLLYQNVLYQEPISYGGATITLQKVDFIYNDGKLDYEPAYLLTVAIGAGSEYAVGSFDKDQMATSEGMPKYDFTMRYEIEKETCSYPIVNTHEPIYEMVYATQKGIYVSESWCANLASNDASPVYWFFRPKGLTLTHYCVWLRRIGTHGELRTPEHDFRARIILEREDGSRYDAIVDSLDQTSVKIGDIGYANWAGYLPTRYRCPSPADQKIVAAYVNGMWRTTDENAWYEYKSYYQYGLEQCLKLFQEGSVSFEDCKNEFETKLSNAIREKPFTFLGGTAKVTESYVDRGLAVLDLPKVISNILMVLHIKAKWLGIVIPVGRPEIVSVVSNPFTTGDTGYITVTVKNTGSVMDKFGVTATCPSPFQVTPEYVDVPAGEERVVHLVVRAGSVSGEFSSTCTVKAYSISKPENYDTATVKVTVKPLIVCTPGHRICSGNLIKRCNEQGTGYTIVDDVCDYTCEYRDGVPFCSEAPKPACQLEGMSCGLFKKCCEGLECVNGICVKKGFKINVGLIIAVISAFGVGFVVPEILYPKMKKEYKIIAGLSIGGLYAYATYKLLTIPIWVWIIVASVAVVILLLILRFKKWIGFGK